MQKKQLSTIQNCKWNTHNKEEWQGRLLIAISKQHRQRAFWKTFHNTHLASPISALHRHRTVAGHKEKIHSQKTLHLPPRIARTPLKPTQLWISLRPIDLFICKPTLKTQNFNHSQRCLAISREDAWQWYLPPLLVYWRSLLASHMHTGAGPFAGRDFCTDICVYWAHSAQHKHHLPCSPQTPTSTQVHTHQGLCTWSWSNTAHPARNAWKASSGPTCLHRQDRELNLCQHSATPKCHRWSLHRQEAFTSSPKLGRRESQPTPVLFLLASLPKGETQHRN